jgi:hypothetical protein
MMSRQHHYNLLSQQFAALKFAGLDGPAHEGSVERACKKSGNRLDCVFAVQDQAEIGKVCSEDWPQRRQNTDIRSRERSH